MTTHQLIQQLVTEGGAIVSSENCSIIELADAQATGRFAVDEEGMGFVRRYKEWLALNKARESDAQRLDWLERNLLSISHDRATCSVDMSGRCVRGQLHNEARGRNAGPSSFRVNHRSIREAVDAAMQWPNEPKPSGFEECASKSPKGNADHRHSESGNDKMSDKAAPGGTP